MWAGGPAAASIAILMLHSGHWGLSDFKQGGDGFRPAITINCQVLHGKSLTVSLTEKLPINYTVGVFVCPHPFRVKYFRAMEQFFF